MYQQSKWYVNLNSKQYFFIRWFLFFEKLAFICLYFYFYNFIFIYLSIFPSILFLFIEFFVFIYRKDKENFIDLYGNTQIFNPVSPNVFSINKTYWAILRLIPIFVAIYALPYSLFINKSELLLSITISLSFCVIFSENIYSCCVAENYDIMQCFCAKQPNVTYYHTIP